MDLLIWLLYAAGVYILVAASYRVIVSLKVLRVQVAETTSKLSGFGPEEVEITKASPSSPEDLPKLLRDQRRRVLAKAQAKELRRHRLMKQLSEKHKEMRKA